MDRVSANSNEKGNPRVGGKQSTVRCFCCGNVGHKANDKVCPQQEKGAESVIIRAISRKCAKLNGRHQRGGKAARIAE